MIQVKFQFPNNQSPVEGQLIEKNINNALQVAGLTNGNYVVFSEMTDIGSLKLEMPLNISDKNSQFIIEIIFKEVREFVKNKK